MKYIGWNLEIKLPGFFRAPGSACRGKPAWLFVEFFYNNVILPIK
jgi:hypothetical protein